MVVNEHVTLTTCEAGFVCCYMRSNECKLFLIMLLKIQMSKLLDVIESKLPSMHM